MAGYHFRVEVSPASRQVDWLDCPSQYPPSGYSSARYVAAADSGSEPEQLPYPTPEQMGDEILGWLTELDEHGEYPTVLTHR